MAVKDIYQAVLGLEVDKTADLVQKELGIGTDVQSILKEGLIAPMDEVGRLFSEGDLFLPEMARAAQAMKAGMAVLRPLLTESQAKPKGTIVLGTVKGDLHDIGKNLVAIMLEGGGFKVVDLGVDQDSDNFYKAALENKADIVGLSALLTTTMPAMKATVAFLKENAPRVKIIVGGAPVTEKFAAQIGADGYSDDAPGAVELSRKLTVQ
jgi:5-methyltetrahydrofolate--homocysteine methyltransferase